MIIYRPHRGGLAEAMAEAKEFETEEEMKWHIYEITRLIFLIWVILMRRLKSMMLWQTKKTHAKITV